MDSDYGPCSFAYVLNQHSVQAGADSHIVDAGLQMQIRRPRNFILKNGMAWYVVHFHVYQLSDVGSIW